MEESSPKAPGNGKYGGFWIRLLAYIIDGILISILGYIIGGSNVVSYTEYAGTMSMSVNFFGWYTLIPIVYTIGFWIWRSTTPGKMVFGLKIVDENGKNMTPGAAVIRYIGYILSAIILFIGYFMIGFSKTKQGLHDKIAKTYVVKK